MSSPLITHLTNDSPSMHHLFSFIIAVLLIRLIVLNDGPPSMIRVKAIISYLQRNQCCVNNLKSDLYDSVLGLMFAIC